MQLDLKEFNDETTLGEIVDLAVEIKSAGHAQSTVNGYRKKAKQVKGWIGDRKACEFSDTHWAKFKSQLLEKYKPKTISNFMAILDPTFDLLIANDFLSSNPFAGNKIPQPVQQVPDVFTVAQIKSLVEMKMDNEAEILLISFGLITGLRLGELLALNAEGFQRKKSVYCVEITLSTSDFRTPKTKRSYREVNLCSNAISISNRLKELAQARGASCIEVTHRDNKTIETQTRTLLAFNTKRNETFKKVDDFRSDFFIDHCKRCEVDYIPPSNMRHTYASQLLTQGVPLAYVGEQMGHTTQEMIEKHYGVWIKEDGVETVDKANKHFDNYFDLNAKAANDANYEKSSQNSWWNKFINLFRNRVA